MLPLHSTSTVGQETRNTYTNLPQDIINYPTAFPITPVQLKFPFQASIIRRTQFPLYPGYATTTYKCQSRSMSRVIAHLQYTASAKNGTYRTTAVTTDNMYVQCSRTTLGADLMLYPKLPKMTQTKRQHFVTSVLESMTIYPHNLFHPEQNASSFSTAFHNGQGCINKLHHYSTDAFYSKLDVICLAELHSPLQGRSITKFNIAAEIPGRNANGSGLAVFINQRMISNTVFAERFSNHDGMIELIAIQMFNSLCLFIYCNPKTTPIFLCEILSNTLSYLIQQRNWTQRIHCFGDFNQSLNRMTKTYLQQNFQLLIQQTEYPTHQNGNYLDRCLANSKIKLNIRPTYWSDHSAIWCDLPHD